MNRARLALLIGVLLVAATHRRPPSLDPGPNDAALARDPSWIEALIDLETGDDESVLEAFGDSAEDRRIATNVLTPLLDHPDPRVRVSAIRLVVHASIARAPRVVAALSSDDAHEPARLAARIALSRNAAELIEAARSALTESSNDATVRVCAELLAAHPIVARELVPDLVARTKHTDPRVRIAVFRALGRIGGDDTVEPFALAIAQEGDPLVRRAIEEAVARVDPPIFTKLPTRWCPAKPAREGDGAGFLAAKEWFERLWFAPLGPFVRVHQAGRPFDDHGEGRAYGFLIRENADGFTIRNTDLTETMYSNSEDFRPKPVDLETHVRAALASRALSSSLWSRRPLFGRWMGAPNYGLFVVAVACEERGHHALALELSRIAQPSKRSLLEETRAAISAAVEEDWKWTFMDPARTFRSVHADYRRWATELAPDGGDPEMLAWLDEMAALESTPIPDLPPERLAEELVRRLPLGAGRMSYDTLLGWSGGSDDDERIIALGLTAVPALMRRLDDGRPTRCGDYGPTWGGGAPYPYLHPVERRAMALLERLALRSFENRSEVEAWYAEVSEQGYVDSLFQHVRSDDWPRVYRAIHLLIAIGQRDRLLDEAERIDRRYTVASALGELTDARSLRSLKEWLRSDDAWVSTSAADALRERGHVDLAAERVLRRLEEGPEDWEPLVRFLARVPRRDVLDRTLILLQHLPADARRQFMAWLPSGPVSALGPPGARREAYLDRLETVLMRSVIEDEGPVEPGYDRLLRDESASNVAGLWPDRYPFFDVSWPHGLRRRQRLRMIDVWRRRSGQPPLPLAAWDRPTAPTKAARRVVERYEAATTRPGRWLASRRIERSGPEVLTALCDAQRRCVGTPHATALDQLARTVVASVLRTRVDGSAAHADVTSRLARLRGRALTGTRLVAAVYPTFAHPPPAVRALTLRVSRSELDRGVTLALTLEARPERGPDPIELSRTTIGDFGMTSTGRWPDEPDDWIEVAEAIDEVLRSDDVIEIEIRSICRAHR